MQIEMHTECDDFFRFHFTNNASNYSLYPVNNLLDGCFIFIDSTFNFGALLLERKTKICLHFSYYLYLTKFPTHHLYGIVLCLVICFNLKTQTK